MNPADNQRLLDELRGIVGTAHPVLTDPQHTCNGSAQDSASASDRRSRLRGRAAFWSNGDWSRHAWRTARS